MFKKILFPIFLFSAVCLQAQMTGMEMMLNSFTQWEIVFDGEQATLETIESADYTSWVYTIPPGKNGIIYRKKRKDASNWILEAGNGELLSAHTEVPKEYNKWIISNEAEEIFTLTCTNYGNEWILESKAGKVTYSTITENDFREWTVNDSLPEEYINFKFFASLLVLKSQLKL